MDSKEKQMVILMESIEEKQKEMITIGIAKGLTSEETVRCSEELDHLLNLYQRMTLDEKVNSLIKSQLNNSIQ